MKVFLRGALVVVGMVCISVAILTGCKGAANSPDLNKSYSCTANIDYNNFACTAQLARLDSGAWEVLLLSPSSVKDIKLTYQSGDVTVSYKGLSFSLPDNSLPVQPVIDNIVGALDNAANGIGLEFDKDGKNVTVSGVNEEVNYAVTVNTEGAIVSLSMPDIGMEVTFEDFAFGDNLASTVGSDTTTTPAATTAAPENNANNPQ